MKNNYVYQLIDPRTNKPFYVGEGKGDRAYSHAKFKSGCNNPHKDRTIRKIQSLNLEVEVKIIKECLTKEEAVSLEEQLILEIGIHNLTNICKNANPPIYFGEENGFYGKTHSIETKRRLGDINRGKDLKTPKGKKAISDAMKERWKDPSKRENQINSLKSRKGEKRSKEAIESYQKAAQKRDQNMTPEQRTARTLAGCATKKIKYAGMKRQLYIDHHGKKRFRWVSAS
jgi:hypothetical protein